MGQRRRQRRKQRREAQDRAPAAQTTAIETVPSPDSNGGGRGEEPYLTPVQENKILGMAVRQRWPLTEQHKRAAVGVLVRNMRNEDGRISNGAVRNLVSMEAQNLEQEKRDAGGEQVNVHVTVDERRTRLLGILAALRERQVGLEN